MADNVDRNTMLKEIRELREEFIEIATVLDKHHDNVKITRVAGGAAGVVGGGLAIALILAPFTAGISLVVVGGVGVGVSVAGALTGLGGMGVGKIMEQRLFKKAELKWKTFCEHFNMYGMQRVRDFQSRKSKVEVVGDAVKQWHKVMVALGVIDKADDIALVLTAGFRVASAGTRTVATAGRVVSAFASPMAILGFVGMGLSVFDIVRGAMDIHKETKSPAGDHLRKLAEQLDELIDLVENY